MMAARPRLALVPGEPAGIGPELCVRLAQNATEGDLLAFADPEVLLRAAHLLKLPLHLTDEDTGSAPGRLPIVEIPCAEPVRFGEPRPANAQSTLDALLRAGQRCLRGELRGMVTGPVHKAAINAGGIAYSGTTELLAGQADCPVVMMLATAELRVALATTHLPLRAVPDAITAASLRQTLAIVGHALRTQFAVAVPRILVLGLNPHAGEDGLLGREEIELISPVLDDLRGQGMQLIGPLPADTAFLPHRLREADAVLAMYHDQGLPVLKYSGFERAVNITLGLPYPRVAVDHGTALEIAGRGLADVSSLALAARLCAGFARNASRTGAV